MAREYARVRLTIWTDPDFRRLTVPAQRLYFELLTNGDINLCGVSDWREARLVKLARNLTVQDLREAAFELGVNDFIAVDPDTEEVLVRSFVRHDGVLKSPNITKSMVKDYGTIASQMLMAVVSREVRRAYREHPEWKGFDDPGLTEPVRKQFPEADSNPFERVPEWFHIGSKTVPDLLGGPEGEPFQNGSPIPLPTTHYPTQPSGVAPRSDERPTPKQGTRLPEDFTVTEGMVRWASENAPLVSIPESTARFIDYWRGVSGSKGRKLDWEATWRNWLRKDQDDQSARQQRPGYRNQNQIMHDMRAKALQRTQAMETSALSLIEGGTQ
jgi:hypothetical protein